MCNFAYIAFSFNRISLLGKDHGRIVTFFSKVGVIKYTCVCLFISIVLSAIKYFKYDINYNQPDLKYPVPKESDMYNHIFRNNKIQSVIFNDVYFIINSITDLINYVLFVILCFVIDVCMVFQLRKVLNEKTKTTETLSVQVSTKKTKNKKPETEEAISKAIKMVVINTTIALFFKLPLSFLPVINVIANYFYKNENNRLKGEAFSEFHFILYEAGFHELIPDLSDFLYNLAISIQFLIYYHFDKKFKTGFNQLINRKERKI